MRRDVDEPFEKGECFTTQFSQLDTGKYEANNRQYYGFYDGNSGSYSGGTGKTSFNGFMAGVYEIQWGTAVGPVYKILQTDYTSYTVYYSCTQWFAGITILEAVWIATRSKLEDGSAAFNTMLPIVNGVLDDKLPHYDYNTRMRTTQ